MLPYCEGNVNGHRIVRMADLRASLERDESFSSIKTWMQSGNVIFQSRLAVADLNDKIQSILRQDFALEDVPVMIRTAQEIQRTIDSNPFATRKQQKASSSKLSKYKEPNKRIFVAFLDQTPNPELLTKLEQVDYSPEEYRVNKELKIIYFYIPDFAKYKLDTTLFEKQLQLIATSRNWRTVTKVAEVMGTNAAAVAAATTTTITKTPSSASVEEKKQQQTATKRPTQTAMKQSTTDAPQRRSKRKRK